VEGGGGGRHGGGEGGAVGDELKGDGPGGREILC
jgi:hypothetical protein